MPEAELKELESIWVERGLEPATAHEVAKQLTAHDALAAHARDELGITEVHAARPVQAAFASAATFGVGAALPLIVAVLVPLASVPIAVSAASLVCLAGLGGLAAGVGGASIWRGATRVTVWGALAMALTALVGRLFGAAV